jgi:hypothetical protein
MGRPLTGCYFERIKSVPLYYARDGKMLRQKRASSLVAVGALLGIKPIRRDAEHVVALDADAVDDRADDGAGLEWLARPVRRGGGGFFGRGFSRHD